MQENFKNQMNHTAIFAEKGANRGSTPTGRGLSSQGTDREVSEHDDWAERSGKTYRDGYPDLWGPALPAAARQSEPESMEPEWSW